MCIFFYCPRLSYILNRRLIKSFGRWNTIQALETLLSKSLLTVIMPTGEAIAKRLKFPCCLI